MKIVIDILKQIGNDISKGYSECVYQEAVCVLLRKNGIEYSKESVLPIYYQGICIGNVRADIILEKMGIVIECKAIANELTESHLPQIINYMDLTGYTNGIFVNFNQNPSKNTLEYYLVEKTIENNYTFTKNGTCTSDIILDSKGNLQKLNFSDQDKILYIKNHIIYNNNENLFLLKSDVKNLYEQHYPYKEKWNKKCYQEFIEMIEVYCDQKFKDKQINSVKYTNVIQNYRINTM